MKIELHNIKVRDLVQDYQDSAEEGVTAYGGRLDVRPKYQRNFVYDDDKRDAVIDTVRKGFPLNVMYWVKNSDNDFEVLDGQQRTIAICQYVTGDYSINEKYFHTLTSDEQEQILNYELTVYFCEGTDSEKLEWFKTINIAGEELSDQELRNAVYTGEWLTDAKRYFSKQGCPAKEKADKYIRCEVNRQELLELTLKWISEPYGKKDDLNIKKYMADHQKDPNASALWRYFCDVIEWVKSTFVTYYKEMKGLPWGLIYNKYKDDIIDTKALDKEISNLMADEDVTKKSGIFLYVLDRKESRLQIRSFDKRDARTAYQKQKGICPVCGKHFEIEQMHADHIIPWSKGGKTVPENCQMLCAECNIKKSNH